MRPICSRSLSVRMHPTCGSARWCSARDVRTEARRLVRTQRPPSALKPPVIHRYRRRLCRLCGTLGSSDLVITFFAISPMPSSKHASVEATKTPVSQPKAIPATAPANGAQRYASKSWRLSLTQRVRMRSPRSVRPAFRTRLHESAPSCAVPESGAHRRRRVQQLMTKPDNAERPQRASPVVGAPGGGARLHPGGELLHRTGGACDDEQVAGTHHRVFSGVDEILMAALDADHGDAVLGANA